MEYIPTEECKDYYEDLIREFLLDHLKNKVLDNLTFEILLENLPDYIDKK